MGINCSTPSKCLSCNLDFKEQTNYCLDAYRDVKLLASEKQNLVAEMTGHKNKYCTTDALDVWMADAENLQGEIESILHKQHKNYCFCYPRYKIGYGVARKLNLVKNLHARLENLHKARMIIETSDVEKLRIGIRKVLARKVDLENRLAIENRSRDYEFTEVVQKWMVDVHEQSERGNSTLRKVTGVDEANRANELTRQPQRDNTENNAVKLDESNHVNELTRQPQRDNIENNLVKLDECNCATVRHQIGEGIYELLNIIENLQNQQKEWDDKNIFVEKSPLVVEQPSWYSPRLTAYINLKVEEVLRYLMGDEFSIIRIFGVGGIGKTTLLKEINNALYHTSSDNCFSRVIFVTVSQNWSISKIQEEIALRLGVSTGKEFIEENEEENARAIFDALGRDSFLLLMDDIWEDLKFEKIGIRPPGTSAKKSKIVVTGRFANVCSSIGVDKTIHMEYLDEEASWKLFVDACGGEQNQALQQSNIQKIAKDVAKLCGGLPLALTVIGRALADLEQMDDWEEAKQQLIESTTDRDKIEPIVHRLRYSFDRLKDEETKSCFLFCLLFGQSGYIGEDKLIDYWIGEGLLLEKPFSTLRSLRSRGRNVVRILIQACLLEKVGDEGTGLRMHDMIYSMATWIESEKGGPKTLRIRDGNTRLLEKAARAMIGNEWGAWTGGIEPLKLCCPSLKTLSWPSCKPAVARDLFEQMPSLRVLILTMSFYSCFPSSICSLQCLRSLYLRDSLIKKLPVQFGRLVNLLLLDLSLTVKLQYIPKEAVSPLVNLLSLKLEKSKYPHLYEKKEGQVSLHDLEELPRLEELILPDVRSAASLHLLSTLPRLSSLIRELVLVEGNCNMTLFHVLEHFPNLESLCILYFSIEEGSLAGSRDLGALGNRLRRLAIISCSNLAAVHMSWLLCRLPNLESLVVFECPRLEKLYCVQADDGTPSTMNCLSKLKSMWLGDLRELTSIADGQLTFSSLVKLKILGSPKLRKLSFPFVERDRKIRIRRAYPSWEDLEWDDDGSKSMFTPTVF